MKKSLFMLCVAAATLASCSQEDVLDVAATHADNDAINFRARTFKATRGVDVDGATLQAFNVFGIKGMIDDYRDGIQTDPMTDWWGTTPVEFKRSTVSGDADEFSNQYFRSDTPMYFPTDYSWVTLYAFAPTTLEQVHVSLGNPDVEDNGNLVINNYTVNDDINKQEDIIVDATGAVRDDENTTVDLMFKHALSKVFVSKAKNEDARYTYKIAGIRFGNIAMKGDCKYDPCGGDGTMASYFTWTVGTQEAKSEVKFAKGITLDAAGELTDIMTNTGTDGSFLLIPQQLPYKYANEDVSNNLLCTEGVGYIGVLLRITEKNLAGEDVVVYPFSKGVADITETVDGEEYAWGILPVATNWVPGNYIDYQIDFSKGAGFVAPGAEGFDFVITPPTGEEGDEDYDPGVSERKDLEYTPILGSAIKFTVSVWPWGGEEGNESYTESNVQQGGDKESIETSVDYGAFQDAFGDEGD